MGNKLESVKKKSLEAKEIYGTANEQGQEIVDKVKQLNILLESLPDGVDDELADLKEVVSENAKSDAIQDMNTNVKTKLEEGKSIIKESSQEASDQISKNEQVVKTFDSMDNIADFGKNARDTGREKIENITQEFNQTLSDNESLTEAAEAEYEREIDEIENSKK